MQKDPGTKRQIKAQIDAELGRIAELGPMLRGSVSEITRGPRKQGTGVRTAHLLTFKGKGNKTRSVYVPVKRIEEVRRMIARHREATCALDRVVDLSVELFKST